MVGDPAKKHSFPDDLHYVRDGRACGGLSCSTVMPGDQFEPMPRNSTGSVGVILGLKNILSVKAAHPKDCGSYTDENGDRQVGQQPPLTIEIVRNSITERDAENYNEWVVRDYEMLGLFAMEPIQILGTYNAAHEIPEALRGTERITAPISVGFDELFQIFGVKIIHGFQGSTIAVHHHDGRIEACSHGNIY